MALVLRELGEQQPGRCPWPSRRLVMLVVLAPIGLFDLAWFFDPLNSSPVMIATLAASLGPVAYSTDSWLLRASIRRFATADMVG